MVNHNYVKARGQQKLDLMEFLYADYATPTPTSTHDQCLLKGINLYSYWGEKSAYLEDGGEKHSPAAMSLWLT